MTIVSAGVESDMEVWDTRIMQYKHSPLISSFPNMTIASPGDVMELRSCMDFLVNNPQLFI